MESELVIPSSEAERAILGNLEFPTDPDVCAACDCACACECVCACFCGACTACSCVCSCACHD